MIKTWLDFFLDILKAIFRFRKTSAQQQQEEQQAQQIALQQHQQHLQEENLKIDAEHKVDPNMSLQEVEDKLNERF